MSKFLLTLFVIIISTSFIAGWKDKRCLRNFHTVCGHSDVIDLIKQQECDGTRLCYGNRNLANCRKYCQNILRLDIKDFYAIKPYAFKESNFTRLGLSSGSGTQCDQKIVKLKPSSFHGLSSLQKITVSCMKFPSKENPFETLQTVEDLDMSKIEWTEMSEYFFSDFPKLKILKLSEMIVRAITLNSFSQNRELQKITLKSNNLSVIEEKSLEQLHKLTYLEISNNQLNDLRPGMFHGLNKLETLDLSDNKITVLRNKTFVALPKLKLLILEGNQISEIDVKAFSGLPLIALNLRRNRLETWPVGAIRDLGNLTRLILANNKISTLSHGMFKVFGRNRLNTTLLEGNAIHHIGPNTFSGLQLSYLSLRDNNLTVLEPDAFNGLQCEILHLDRNKMSEIKEHAFRNSSISQISLQFNPITVIDTAKWGLDNSILVYIGNY